MCWKLQKRSHRIARHFWEKMLKMNWFFNLFILGTTWSILYTEEVTSSESPAFPNLEVLESFFKSGYGNTSYRESLDDSRPRLIGGKENPLEDLSYRHHGAHPANIKSWKLQCVWNALNVNSGPRRKLKMKRTKTLPEVRELCDNQAWEDCGVDLNNAFCNSTTQYRSIDGTCNNILNTGWGSAPRPFERFIHSDYGNGVSTFRLSADDEPLPNPRKISRALSSSNKAAEPKVTLMLTQWGQFLDHDLTLTPEREVDDELKAKYTEHENIWGFEQCSYYGPFYGSINLAGCIIKCDDTPGCNAFIYYPTVGCYFSDCAVPIPAPTWSYPPYKGYSRNTGEGVIIDGKQLTFSTERVTWETAKDRCTSKNAKLVILNNPQAFHAYATNEFSGERFWLGGSDRDNEGHWTWINHQPFHNFPWGPGEPNNENNEDCLEWGHNNNYNDEDCLAEQRYVCEKDQVEESSTMECCDGGQYDKSVSLGVDCVPINVTDDSFYGRDGRECIRFVRSMPTSSGCVNSPMEQINQNTAFVDGSMVYGSDAEVANFVRTGHLGLLNTTESEHVGNGQPLPPRGGKGFAHQCPIESEERCFLAGDVRVDEIPGLTAMHTTFIRLHNIIAEDLCTLNPSWCGNDEQLFQETRRIVIALIQQITYRDWLPLVVGPTLINTYNLNSVNQGYSDTYDSNVNPTIRNVFATAAFRFGHSLISEVIKTARADSNLPYPGNFFNLRLLECNDTSASSLLKGLTRCPSAPIDAIVEPAFTNHLYADHPADDGIFYGLDLLSINIQRGRDHGISGYTEWRKFCGLGDITTFSQLRNYMPHDLVNSFEHIYQNVHDIDLFPAGMAENPTDDGILGPTFSCLIAKQFANIKHGDRFWYERQGQPKPFTPAQLNSIRSQNLVSILCKVSEHASFSFQPNPFEVESEINPAMNCSLYNFINLQPWNENQQVPVCSDGAVYVGGQCLKFSTDSLSWQGAVEACSSQNGQLATLKDPQAVLAYTENHYENVEFWAGGSDISTEGTWKWITGEPIGQFPWSGPACTYNQQPDNQGGHQDCLVVNWVCGGYDDQGCNLNQRYICEQGDSFVGPLDNIWDNDECRYIRRYDGQSLSDCMLRCSESTDCTAINFAEDFDCVLRACELPVPDPQWHLNRYQGYKIVKELECPGGFLVLSQCFRIFKDTTRSWNDADSKCRSENLILAEPSDTVAIPLREYVVKNYGSGEVWLGARGDGIKHVWQHSGNPLFSNNTLWDNGYLNSGSMINGYCLELDSNQGDLEAKPESPYDVDACTVLQWTLCEDLQQ